MPVFSLKQCNPMGCRWGQQDTPTTCKKEC